MKHAQNINQSWNRDKFTRFDCTNLLNSFWARKKKYMHNYYYFQYSYRITSHFNKILSIMYWSDYFDYILWMDDDAFFGNYNISFMYYFNLIPNNINNDIFLVLPMDHNPAMVFSNFAFFINTTETNNNRAINFLFEWFKSRSLGFQFSDQDAMNYAILQYLIKYDNKFIQYLNHNLLYSNPLHYLLFFKCIEYCKLCPVDHMCLVNCLRTIHFRRCFEDEILNKSNKKRRKYQYCTMMHNCSIFWAPWIGTNMTDNYDDYNILPFVFQNAYDTHYRYLSNVSYRDPDLKYLRKMYDHTFIIHKRYYGSFHREDSPFLYAYSMSRSRQYMVNYLKDNHLLLLDDSYPDIRINDIDLDFVFQRYQRSRKSFTSYK